MSLSTSNLSPDFFASKQPFLGLAPFLRMSVAGINLLPIGQHMLARAELETEDAELLMNLANVMLCLGQRDIGLALQDQALQMQRVYHLAAAQQPAAFRLLLLVFPGDLSTNIPLDCLLEGGDIDIDFYYVTPGTDPLAVALPAHDVLLVAISEFDGTHASLKALEAPLSAWPKPVINQPRYIPNTRRNTASALLQNIPGLFIPPTVQVSRTALVALIQSQLPLSTLLPHSDFPIIMRPVGSHAGVDLDKIEDLTAMATYLARVEATAFFISPFVDYRSADGLFRKYRIVLINGVAYASHMAISSHWMIHYVNAGMYDDAAKRLEEAAFMQDFAAFATRHQLALEAIYRKTQLDYVCIDCAETPTGALFVFEIDHAMVVHAMDPEDLFPYKQAQIAKAKRAFRQYLTELTSPVTPVQPSL